MDFKGALAAGSSFLEHAKKRAVPLWVHWDLTWRCDLSCVHCYLNDRRLTELSTEECLRILDELAEVGTLLLLFSGGDLFLRPDALEILRAARGRGFDVKLITHGNHITEEVADALAQMGVTRVGMSLYSIDSDEHDAITRVRESHGKTIEAARRLVARGVKVQFKTPVMVHNRAGWSDIGQLADALGVDWEIDGNIQPDDQADFGLCGLNTSWEERVLAVMTALARRGEEIPPLHEVPDTPSDRRTCSAAHTSAFITPDGRLQPCINWREDIGSLRERSFRELWWDSPVAKKQREVRRASYLVDCDGCAFHGKCAYCPGISHAERGDAGRRSTWICERTHRAMAAIEYLRRLQQQGRGVPGAREEVDLFDGPPTYAERQWAARRAGLSRPADRLRPSARSCAAEIPLVQIGPSR